MQRYTRLSFIRSYQGGDSAMEIIMQIGPSDGRVVWLRRGVCTCVVGREPEWCDRIHGHVRIGGGRAWRRPAAKIY